MTISADTTNAEIARFLKGNDPGVLCITGKWGVGKTFLWRQTIEGLSKTGGLDITTYSYVSLFGLTSLDDVKFALFENMEWLDKDATSFAQRGRTGAKALAARAKKLSELAGALPFVGAVFAKARPLYFSLIQNQIICIDDIDRRSAKLDLKDVLGLISFLREQRDCKVALILNEEKLDNQAEFNSLLDKVVEEKVVLAPTPAESIAVAFQGKKDPLTLKIKVHAELLGIRNIRVIKHVERLARRIDELLLDFSPEVRDQATHSITLFGRVKYDAENSISLNFLKKSSLERHLSRNNNQAPSEEEIEWENLLETYKFRRADDFDLSLMKYVDTMIMDINEIRNEAKKIQEQNRMGKLREIAEASWQKFHYSFDDNEDEVIREIVNGAKQSFEVISLPNLNEIILLFKNLGRTAEAEDILEFFARNQNNPNYWTEEDPFGRGPFDESINKVIKQHQPSAPEELDLAGAILKAGKEYDRPTIAYLATVPVMSYCHLITNTRGEKLRPIILSALEFRRISNASDEMRQVVRLMEEALRIVGRKSPLNALRIKKYGVSVDP